MKTSLRCCALLALLALGLRPVSALAEKTDGSREVPMKPKAMTARDGAFHCDMAPTLLVGRSLAAEGSRAALPLQDQLSRRFGSALVSTAPGKQLPSTPFILIGLA